MGKILSGILSGVSGKVAGVVGGKWKTVDYLRAYVIPANPNSTDQQTQRNLFKGCVEFAKNLVGQVFNAYTDKFLKSMSGFNFFIKRNIDYFTAVPEWASLKITEGKLFFGGISNAVYDTDTVLISFSDSLGNNGATDDKVFAFVYDSGTGLFFFADAEVDRVTGAISVDVVESMTVANLKVYAFAAKYDGTVVELISNSAYFQAVAA
jgi:hypothetical protein